MNEKHRSQSGPRYAYIDALRAIAALLVVWSHTSEVFIKLGSEIIGKNGAASGTHVSGGWLFHLSHDFNFGRIGVIIFFAISGYVIPFSLKGGKKDGIYNFAISRFFRLYPAYWISIVPAAATFYWLWGNEFSIRDVLLNLTMIPEWLGAKPAEGIYWTLAIELLFYIICGTLFAVNILRNPLTSVILSSALMLIFIKYRGDGIGPITANLSIMFFGTLFRYYMHNPEKSKKNQFVQYYVFAYMALWLAIPIAATVFLKSASTSADSINVIRAYTIGIIIFAFGTKILKINNSALNFLGRISYSIYLLHPIVIYGALWLALKSELSSVYGLHLSVYITAVTGVTVLMAWVNYNLIENPSIKIGKRLMKNSLKT